MTGIAVHSIDEQGVGFRYHKVGRNHRAVRAIEARNNGHRLRMMPIAVPGKSEERTRIDEDLAAERGREAHSLVSGGGFCTGRRL